MSGKDAVKFLNRYNQMHWMSTDLPKHEIALPERCSLTLINFDDSTQHRELQAFMEFQPPSWMPAGNVGTATSHFFSLIKSCRLDSSVIAKLKLDFSGSIRSKIYGAVPFVYDDNEATSDAIAPGEVRSRSGARILSADEYADEIQIPTTSRPAISEDSLDNDQTDEPDDQDEACEEWERFDALHDDPYKVERRDKANIKYEDKSELPWEKGGSGLLFHTDERTWRKLDPLRKEEIFDEPASFDWDIDMDLYENPAALTVGPSAAGHWGASRDTADLIDMQCAKDGIDLPCSSHTPFEEYHAKSNNYGLRLMRRMGWKSGMRLGRTHSRGLLVPIRLDHALRPNLRPGLGYYGTRQDRQRQTNTGVKRSVYIRTAFDCPAYVSSRSGGEGASQSLYRQDPDEIIKYRALPTTDSCISQNPNNTSRPSSVAMTRTIILMPQEPVSKEGITFVSGGVLNPK